jgi:hypothetical protein
MSTNAVMLLPYITIYAGSDPPARLGSRSPPEGQYSMVRLAFLLV